jgi:hypothetical protein
MPPVGEHQCHDLTEVTARDLIRSSTALHRQIGHHAVDGAAHAQLALPNRASSA